MTRRELAAEWVGFTGAMGILLGNMALVFGWFESHASIGAWMAMIGATLLCLSTAALQVLKRAESQSRRPKPDPARCRWKECFAPECETHCPKAMAARFAEQKHHSRPRKRESEGKIRRRDDPPG